MKKQIILQLLISLVIFAVLIGAYLQGRKDVWENEFIECRANLLELTQWETNQPPELKEYVKARYYYLANKISDRSFVNPCDYGPVNTNVQHLAIFKGPSSGQAEYLDFLQRYGLPKN
jgi:hypothetical protein